MPLASRTQSKPSRRKTLASLPPPIATRCGSRPARSQPRLGQRQRRRVRRHPVAAEQLFDPHVDVAAVLARAPGAGVGDLARRPRPPARRRGCAPRRGSRSGRGRRCPRCRRAIRPTFAVVSSSSRPSSIRAIAAAAAAIALLPSSGRMPGVRLDADEVGEDLLLGRGRDDHLADRAGVVEDEAGARAQLRERRRPSPRAAPAPRRRSAPARSRPAAGRSTWRATSSMKTATAALLSAPRIVSPRLRKTPSSSTTSTWPLCGTVSMWAQNITHPVAAARPSGRSGCRRRLRPARRRRPRLTSSPSARSSAARVSATSRSSPVGLRTSQ